MILEQLFNLFPFVHCMTFMIGWKEVNVVAQERKDFKVWLGATHFRFARKVEANAEFVRRLELFDIFNSIKDFVSVQYHVGVGVAV